MRQHLIIILLSSLLSSSFSLNRCSHPTGTMTGDIELQQTDGSGKKIIRTVINSNIALQETLCYQITYNYTTDALGNTKEKRVLYTLSYDNLIHVYNYKNAYDFAIPATEVMCWCDCPGGANQCDSDTDSCGRYDKSEDTCVNWYQDGQSLDGCLWITGSGQSCCSVDVIRYSADTYKAIEIASPITRAELRLNVIDFANPKQSVHLVKDKIYKIDLDTGTTADELVTLNIATSSTSSILPAGWYFGRVGSADVKTNVKINGLNEWNMNKLGWMKIKNGFESIRKSTVREAFGAATINCGENALDTYFAASFYNRFPAEAEDATDLYMSKVNSIMRNDSARQISAYHLSSPRLDIKLTFNQHSKVVFLFDKSSLRDFNAKILLDKFSNRYINMTLFDASGSITGSLKVNGKETDNFYVYIPDEIQPRYETYVRISSTCGVKGDELVAEMCLKPLGPDIDPICKEVRCTEVKMDDFAVRDDELEYERVEHDDILSLSTWGKYLNPVSWFTGGKPGWVKSIIIGVAVVFLIFIIGILVKLARMFNCIFKCITCCGSWKKKSKSTYAKVRIRAGSAGKYRRQKIVLDNDSEVMDVGERLSAKEPV